MPRRILLLITDLEIGGTPTVVRELAVRLHDPPVVVVEVACLKGWGPVAAQIEAQGVRVTSLDARGAADLARTVWRLRKLIRRGPVEGWRGGAAGVTYASPQLPFDTVFSFLVHANAVAAMASIFCPGVRFLQSIQTTQPTPEWHWRVQELAEVRAERVVVPSPSAAVVARRWAGAAPDKIAVIPNAIDADAFDRSPIPSADPRPYPVVFIGRLDPVKRLVDLLRAVRSLGSTVTLDVFGDGVLRAWLQREILRYHLQSQVTLHGAVPGPQSALREAGVLVLPSDAEGFGLVLIEAMAAGVPIVATDVAGIRDVVRHGVTGLLVPPRNPPALAVAIRRVVEDRNLRAGLIERGLAEVRQRYAWSAVIQDYRQLLGIEETPRHDR